MPLKEMLVRILAQILGGLWAYRLNQFAWDFALTSGHGLLSKATSFGECWTFLNVITSVGFLIGNYTHYFTT
jgi:hypothetical protein